MQVFFLMQEKLAWGANTQVDSTQHLCTIKKEVGRRKVTLERNLHFGKFNSLCLCEAEHVSKRLVCHADKQKWKPTQFKRPAVSTWNCILENKIIGVQ